MSDVAPWFLTIAGGAATLLCGAIGKLWTDNRALRRELADAHETNAHLQAEAFSAHRRDLRMFAGLPTSIDPPPDPGELRDPLRPPIVIRQAQQTRRTQRKKRDDSD